MATYKPMDKIVYAGVNYHILDVMDWQGDAGDVFGHLNGDHMLLDFCLWAERTGETEDSEGNITPTYGTEVLTKCNFNQPSRRWQTTWPATSLAGSAELSMPGNVDILIQRFME
jgi:hypothetical protein